MTGASVPGKEPRRTHAVAAALAFAPAALVLPVELFVLVPRAGGSSDLRALVGAAAGVVTPVAVALLGKRDALRLGVLSIAATLAALLLSFAIWSGAADIACRGATDCPFG